jgi:dipeptidyl aminopeptidase/acylaminoacyl peptidase
LPLPQPLEYAAGDATLSGQLHRPTATTQAPVPALVFLDGPPSVARRATPQAAEPTLAKAGFTVFAPNLHGVTGYGRAVSRALLDDAESEIELADVVDAVSALRAETGVDPDRVALVGRGYGSLLALLAIGARPGVCAAAVAIDPITDWDQEFDGATGSWRRWLLDHFGAPLVRRGPYAARQPATFAALIDVPLLLLATGAAPPSRCVQLDAFAARLTDLGIAFERETVNGPPNADLRRAASFLHRAMSR